MHRQQGSGIKKSSISKLNVLMMELQSQVLDLPANFLILALLRGLGFAATSVFYSIQLGATSWEGRDVTLNGLDCAGRRT